MGLWIAVPEDEEGMWWGDPIGGDTEEEIRKLATAQWSGKLPGDIDVVIYRCNEGEVMQLPKQELEAPAEPEPAEVVRCPNTADMFAAQESP